MAINLIDDPEEFERVSVSHVKHEWAKKYGESFSSPNVKGMPRGPAASESPNAEASALASPSCSRRDLPDYVFSAYQSGCGDVRLVDNATKEVLSDKFSIVFGDTNAGYFVAVYRDGFRNEYFLVPCNATLERYDKNSQTWQPHRPPPTEDVQ